MSIRTGMFPPPNAGNTGGPLSYGQGGLPPVPNPFAPMPPMPLAGMPPPPMMPPMMGGGMPPPPMGSGIGSSSSGIQASNAPRRRSFGDYLENTMSSNQPRPPQTPQFAPRPDSRQARPLMNGGIVQGYDDGGSVVQGFAPGGNVNQYSSNRPNMREFMDATGATSAQASQALYGSVGSNVDIRDWDKIMDSENILQASQAATSQMYGSGASVATDDRFYDSAGNYTPTANVGLMGTDVGASTGGAKLQVAGGQIYVMSSDGLPLTGLSPQNAASFGITQNQIDAAIAAGGNDNEGRFDGTGYVPYDSGNLLVDYSNMSAAQKAAIASSGGSGASGGSGGASSGASGASYDAVSQPVNVADSTDYNQFNGDVGNFSNTGENFALYGPNQNIPAFNSQYINAPSGGLTTTNGPNMTAVSGIGALNMPARPVDLDVLDWLSEPTYGSLNSPVDMNQGGSVPRQTIIRDDPHMLAYINPEEAQLLKDLGGTGEPGPGGIPAYAPGFEGSSSMGGSQGGTSNYSSYSHSTDNDDSGPSADEIAEAAANFSAANQAAAESMLSAGIGGVSGTNYNPTANDDDDDGPSNAEIFAKYTDNETSGLDDYADTLYNNSWENGSIIPGSFVDNMTSGRNTNLSNLAYNTDTLDSVVNYNQNAGNQNDGNNNVTTLTESQLNTASSDNQGLTSSELLLAEQQAAASQAAASQAAAAEQAAAAKEAASQAWFNSLTPPASSSPSLTPDEAAIIETESFNPNVSAQTFTPGLSTPLTSGVGPTGITSIAPVNRSQPVALAGSGSSDSLSANDIFDIIGTGDSNANILSLTPEDAVRAEIKSTFPGRPDFGSGLPFSTTAPGDDYTPTSSELAAQLASQGLTNITPGTLSFEDQIAQYNNGNLSEANLDLRDIGRELQSGTLTVEDASLTVEDALGNGLGSVRPANAGLGRGSGFKSLEQLKAEISEAEGTSDEGGYDRLLDKGETGTFSDNKPLTEMTLAEAIAFGTSDEYRKYSKDVLGRGPDELPSTPMGKYQIIGTTLAEIVGNPANGFDPNALFNEKTQEKLGEYIINEKRGYNRAEGPDVLDGGITQAEFEKGLGQEFEGIQNMGENPRFSNEDFSLSKVTNGQFNFDNNDDAETTVPVDTTENTDKKPGTDLYLSAVKKNSSGEKLSDDEQRALYGARGQTPNAAESSYIQDLLGGAKHAEDGPIDNRRKIADPYDPDGRTIAQGGGIDNPNFGELMYKAGDSVDPETFMEKAIQVGLGVVDTLYNPLSIFGDEYTIAGNFGKNDDKKVSEQLEAYKNGGTFVYGDDGKTVIGVAAPNYDASGDGNNDTVVLYDENGEFNVTGDGVAASDISASNANSDSTIDIFESKKTYTNTEDGVVTKSGTSTDTDTDTDTDTTTETDYTTDQDGNRICNEAGYVYDVSSDSCIPAVAEEESTDTSLNIGTGASRSFEDVLKNIQTKATTIAPISANIKPMAMGGMAGLNRTADNFLRALGG